LWFAKWRSRRAARRDELRRSFFDRWQGVLAGRFDFAAFFRAAAFAGSQHKTAFAAARRAGEKMRGSIGRKHFRRGFACRIARVAAWQAGSLKVGAFFSSVWARLRWFYISRRRFDLILRKFKNFGSFSVAQADQFAVSSGQSNAHYSARRRFGRVRRFSGSIFATNLVREFDFTRNQKLPSCFLSTFKKARLTIKKSSKKKPAKRCRLVPTIRARIAFVNGQPFDFQKRETRQQQGQIGREFAVTYRPNLDENETVIAGDWWNDGEIQTKRKFRSKKE
jgi:hypothetical protein